MLYPYVSLIGYLAFLIVLYFCIYVYFFLSVVLYAIFASYFAGVMVRLMLTLTPIVCVLAAIAFSKTFEIYLKDDTPRSSSKEHTEEQQENKNDRLYDKVKHVHFIKTNLYMHSTICIQKKKKT